jgi:transcriptional regulator of acetoin/glycerol metabolism
VLEAAARQALLDYPWPGNVRQLRNVLRTLAALCDDGCIRFGDLPTDIRRAVALPVGLSAAANNSNANDSGPLEDAECRALLAALQAQHWHMTRTAEQLGISRNTLYRKLRKHGVTRHA